MSRFFFYLNTVKKRLYRDLQIIALALVVTKLTASYGRSSNVFCNTAYNPFAKQ